MSILRAIISWLVDTIGRMGYTGIISLMFLESSFFPFPSEVVMPPAGYLAWKGEMSLFWVLASGIFGSILGALFNYWVALKLGRPFLLRWGKYFFVSQDSIQKADEFFLKHGHISTLIGRLLPVIRQYISLPAGIARMPLRIFTFFTTLGAGIWVCVLTLLGYILGEHQELFSKYYRLITLACVLLALGIILVYVLFLKFRKNQDKM